jgi:hypothetical protein
VQEPCSHHERVGGDHVDVLRAGAIGGRRDRGEQLAVLGLSLDEERVPFADSEGRLDDRVGVARERIGREKAFGRQC